MMIAFVLTTISSIPFMFLDKDSWTKYLVYPLAAIQGIGVALMLNTGTSLISDVLGKDNTSAAFVYGVYSLFDKFANGIIGYLLVALYSKNDTALRLILGIIPTVSAAGCALITFIGVRKFKEKLGKISAGSVMKTVSMNNPKAT